MRLLAVPLAAALAAPAATPHVITLDQAVALALQLQPSLRVARGNIAAAEGRVDQARVARYPTLDAFATGTVATPVGGCVEPACDPLHPIESAELGAQATWRLYDFGATAANVHAAELTADATATTVATSALGIRLAVETAYLEAVARRRLVVVAETTVTSELGHVDQARRFVAAGSQDPIALAQAQARLANARAALAQAHSNEAVALADLRGAIGSTDPAQTFAVAPDWPTRPTGELPALDALVDRARGRRPELVQLDKLALAADAGVTAARAERRPVLSAQAAAGWAPSTLDSEPDPSWSVGLTLTVPIFDGGKSAADARVARGERVTAVATRDELLVSLTTQLEAARALVITNRASVAAADEAVTAAQAQLRLSEARYTNGLGSQIELSDAETAVTAAAGSLVAAQWQLATAWAQLDAALGSAA